MQAIILLFLTALFSSHDARSVYSEPSPIVSSSLGETVMTRPAKEGTYRFSAYVETQPSTGCEYDSTVDVVLSWTRITAGAKTPNGLPGWQRYRVTLHPSGHVEGAEIPSTLFRAKAGTRISFSVDYSAGKGCAPRPAYEIFPLLEFTGK